jgi:predicted Fe-Mo cluster-binding NifX family protein
VKLALTTSEETLDAPLDPRFGRAPRFLVLDTDTAAF